MNRNTEQHFAENPINLDIQRSKFDRSHGHITSFNVGDAVPLYVDMDILPGDTVQAKMGAAVRMSTPIYPVMGNLVMDYYWFFVPNRLVWEHWKEFMGENTTSKWEQTIDYTVPQIVPPTGGWEKGTIADYMGVPTKIDGNLSINALPFRAYALIYNEWFRDQNLCDPSYVSIDDATQTGSNGSTTTTDLQLGGKPFKAAKLSDLFTRALPAPQKGPSILLPLGNTAPIIGAQPSNPYGTVATSLIGETINFKVGTNNSYVSTMYKDNGHVAANGNTIGLEADLSNATGSTINQLRQAFQVQRYYEQLARGGSRYRELIRSMFNVTSPDARMQIPEYLGGGRFSINVDQVVQSSSTDTVSPQGNTAAFSLTNMVDNSFTKSFTEHGILMCIGVIRQHDHQYQQGLERGWSRKDKFDYYFPVFANLGEQAILNKEIYAQGNANDEEIFGYQEAWADYRYKPSRVSGAMRSNYAQTLDSWHYGDYYTSQPILGSTWINETEANVNRTLAVQSSLEDQFIGDFYFKMEYTRPMPIYSIPGLIDHH